MGECNCDCAVCENGNHEWCYTGNCTLVPHEMRRGPWRAVKAGKNGRSRQGVNKPAAQDPESTESQD